jgi:hypothetical protein
MRQTERQRKKESSKKKKNKCEKITREADTCSRLSFSFPFFLPSPCCFLKLDFRFCPVFSTSFIFWINFNRDSQTWKRFMEAITCTSSYFQVKSRFWKICIFWSSHLSPSVTESEITSFCHCHFMVLSKCLFFQVNKQIILWYLVAYRLSVDNLVLTMTHLFEK